MLFSPHLGASRKVQDGQTIHTSFLFASGKKGKPYSPAAHPPNGNSQFWEKLRIETTSNRNDSVHQWLERDLYDYVKALVANARNPEDDVKLGQIARTSA